MTLPKLIIVMTALGFILLTAIAGAQEQQGYKMRKDVESYALGVDFLRNLKRNGIDFNIDMVLRGIQDEATGRRLLYSEDALKTGLNVATTEARRKRVEDRMTLRLNNKEKGEAFLAENKTKEGVVTLSSGLQYKVLKEGNGRKPTDADLVQCLLRGTHIDGTEFYNTERDGQPAILKVSEIIPAWREALKLMPVGSKWRLFIPPVLAYGTQGAGKIGPNETIIYELELVAIK